VKENNCLLCPLLLELLPGGIEALGFAPANLAFFGGMMAMFLIDALISAWLYGQAPPH
jgi:hypothetical protein